MPTINAAGQRHTVQAVIKTPVAQYYATNEPTISQAHVAFTGVSTASLHEGQYPEPRKIVVSTPYVVEFP